MALVGVRAVPPGPRQPATKARRYDLLSQIGLEPAAGLLDPGGNGPVDGSHLSPHAGHDRTGDGRGELHAG